MLHATQSGYSTGWTEETRSTFSVEALITAVTGFSNRNMPEMTELVAHWKGQSGPNHTSMQMAVFLASSSMWCQLWLNFKNQLGPFLSEWRTLFEGLPNEDPDFQAIFATHFKAAVKDATEQLRARPLPFVQMLDDGRCLVGHCV